MAFKYDNALPWIHRPGTDMISKLVLQDSQVINSIVKVIVGDEAANKYTPEPTKCIDGTHCDVLYSSNLYPSFPPVIVEVENKVNDDFIRRLMGHSLSVIKKYSMLPIVLIFSITFMRSDISQRMKKSKCCPFLLHFPCQPWAKSCYFVDRQLLEKEVNQPLDPFVAFCHFLLRQDQSIQNSPFPTDPTMQYLYQLTHQLNSTISKKDQAVDDILSFSRQTKAHFQEAAQTLRNNNHNQKTINHVCSILDDGVVLAESLEKKYEPIYTSSSPVLSINTLPLQSPQPSSDTQDPKPSSDTQDPEPSSSRIQPTQPNQNKQSNWTFVEDYINQLPDNENISWKTVFLEGKKNGYFSTYTGEASVKSSYHRYKRRKLTEEKN
ncbi:unnamed protein product [Cunninghamella blakesleeana]